MSKISAWLTHEQAKNDSLNQHATETAERTTETVEHTADLLIILDDHKQKFLYRTDRIQSSIEQISLEQQASFAKRNTLLLYLTLFFIALLTLLVFTSIYRGMLARDHTREAQTRLQETLDDQLQTRKRQGSTAAIQLIENQYQKNSVNNLLGIGLEERSRSLHTDILSNNIDTITSAQQSATREYIDSLHKTHLDTDQAIIDLNERIVEIQGIQNQNSLIQAQWFEELSQQFMVQLQSHSVEISPHSLTKLAAAIDRLEQYNFPPPPVLNLSNFPVVLIDNRANLQTSVDELNESWREQDINSYHQHYDYTVEDICSDKECEIYRTINYKECEVEKPIDQRQLYAVAQHLVDTSKSIQANEVVRVHFSGAADARSAANCKIAASDKSAANLQLGVTRAAALYRSFSQTLRELQKKGAVPAADNLTYSIGSEKAKTNCFGIEKLECYGKSRYARISWHTESIHLTANSIESSQSR